MKLLRRTVFLGLIAASCGAQAQWSYFAGTGHYYQAVLAPNGGIDWADAKTAATAMGGYLATLQSDDENDYVYGLINSPDFWWGPDTANNLEGPWIGGRRASDNSGDAAYWTWAWDNGEAWGYTRWSSGEPNNYGGSEQRAIYFGPGNARNKVWNDINKDFHANGFVVESLVPEPGSLAAIGAGFLSLIVARRKKAG